MANGIKAAKRTGDTPTATPVRGLKMNHQKADAAGMPAAVLDNNQFDKNQRAIILGQLARIKNSRAFGTSARAKEFFSYVVEQAVEGHTENLKERAIGVGLFDRAPSYMTGEDPIVRVQAAEVRKRLAVYYTEEERRQRFGSRFRGAPIFPYFTGTLRRTPRTPRPGIK